MYIFIDWFIIHDEKKCESWDSKILWYYVYIYISTYSSHAITKCANIWNMPLKGPTDPGSIYLHPSDDLYHCVSSQGVTFPAMMAMWARWAPPLERSRLMTISGQGSNFGAFFALPLTGYICQTLGWPAVFYICGEQGDTQTPTSQKSWQTLWTNPCLISRSCALKRFFFASQGVWVASGPSFGFPWSLTTPEHIAESAKRREVTSLTPLDLRLDKGLLRRCLVRRAAHVTQSFISRAAVNSTQTDGVAISSKGSSLSSKTVNNISSGNVTV